MFSVGSFSEAPFSAKPDAGAAAVTLFPALFTNSNTFYSPTVTPGAVPLSPSLYTNSQTFYSPTVTVGTVTLTPARYDNSQTFYSATLTSIITLAPSLYANSQTFYSATLQSTNTLTASLFTNTQTFYNPTATVGATTLQPALFTNTQTFYSPTVKQNQTLVATRYDNSQTFYSPTVELSTYVITAAQARRLMEIHLLHGLGVSPLVVGSASREAGVVQQTVTQAGATVTVVKTAGVNTFAGDPGTMIDELAALHGLTADLIVTPTSRTAGALSQTLAQSGTTTTVTRV